MPRTALATLLLAALLGGCAANAIRVQRASEVAAAGEAAGAETGKFLGKVRATRRDANVALVASDPSCQWGPSIIVMGTNGATTPPPLCAAPPIDKARGDFEFSLSNDYRAAQRAAGLMRALGAYTDAVGAIAAGDEADAHGGVAEAHRLVVALQSDVAMITDSAPLLDKAQLSALGKLAALVDDLNVERIKVEKLRRLVAQQEKPAEQLAAELKDQVDILATLSRGDLQVTSEAYRRALQRTAAKDSADFAARRELIGKMALVEAQARDTAAFGAALKQVVGEVATAHARFLEVLAGNFSEADRRAMADIARDRMRRAINSFAAVVAAF